MSEYAQIRGEFLRDAVKGIIPQDAPELRAGVLAEWIHRLDKPLQPKLQENMRLVNRFTLGADPEFAFEASGSRYDARNYKLKTGLAFGADQNGRLVEVRPAPNRSALSVVASMLVELRMLAQHIAEPLLIWRSGAFTQGDGLGGHVHFGRKRPTRANEIAALDEVYNALMALGAFPVAEQQQRQAGDALRQRYGSQSEYRIQVHGYEYRTLPSWLDSPQLAFLVLTLCKLAVFDPDLPLGWKDKQISLLMVERLLAYYKALDDDARLAHWMLQRYGFPVHIGGDFRKVWGLKDVPPKQWGIIPPFVKPDKANLQETFALLMDAKPLEFKAVKPYWIQKAPEGFKAIMPTFDTTRMVGMGELLWDAVMLGACPVTFKPMESGFMFSIGYDLERKLPRDWQKRVRQFDSGFHNFDAPRQAANPDEDARYVVKASSSGGSIIYIGKRWRKPNRIQILKKCLFDSGAFPVFRIHEANEEKRKYWEALLGKPVKEKPPMNYKNGLIAEINR